MLPVLAMDAQQIEIAWRRDRAALRACASRHSGLVEFATGASGPQ